MLQIIHLLYTILHTDGHRLLIVALGLEATVTPLEIQSDFSDPHQTFQVPKIEVLNLIRLFWGWGFPY